jgi:poly(A) polymerase
MENLPIIIPRAEHPISRRLLNPNALKILYRLNDNGFIAYLVGGCVRDLLLGREPKDFDVATDATPAQIKRLFRNCRLIGRRFRLAHLHFNDEIIEVATFRASAVVEEEEAPEAAAPEAAAPEAARQPHLLKSEDGMLLRDNLFGSPEEDAWRRDFTVNALYYNVADFSIVDYVGGMADLRQGVIRSIGDPRQRFTEDPVRMLRAVRFAAMLGLTIEAGAWQAIKEMAATVSRAAPARLYEEMLKLLLLGEGEKTYQLLRQSGLFGALFPQMAGWLAEESEGYPHVWTSKALAWVDNRLGQGAKVSPPLLLALFFGQYLAEKSQEFRRRGAPAQQSVDLALAEFLGETAPTVLIPHRVAMQMREISLLQLRFSKIPGRRPEAICARPGFADALAYLRFCTVQEPQAERTLAWWERFAAGQPPRDDAAVSPEAEKGGGSRGRRRRRKKRSRPRPAPENGV